MGSDLIVAGVVFVLIWLVCMFDGPITSMLTRLDRTEIEDCNDNQA